MIADKMVYGQNGIEPNGIDIWYHNSIKIVWKVVRTKW